MFNYDYLEASPLIIRQTDSIDFWLIGAGGNGFLAVLPYCATGAEFGQVGEKGAIGDRRSRYS